MKKAWILSYPLSAQRRLRSAWADSEDSDQPGHPPRLICVFAGRTSTLLVLSCRGSFLYSVHDLTTNASVDAIVVFDRDWSDVVPVHTDKTFIVWNRRPSFTVEVRDFKIYDSQPYFIAK